MNDSYEHGLFPILVIVSAFAIAKILAKMGLVTKQNADTVAKTLAVGIGIIYAVSFEFVRSFGPLADFFLRIAFGIMVGGIMWVFILVGVGGAISDDKESK